jgi:hypothetical protein
MRSADVVVVQIHHVRGAEAVALVIIRHRRGYRFSKVPPEHDAQVDVPESVSLIIVPGERREELRLL